MLETTDYQLRYQHLPLSRLQQIRRITALLLKTFDSDTNLMLQSPHYINMAEELSRQWRERINYLDHLINQHAQPPIPLPKPTQPTAIFLNQ